MSDKLALSAALSVMMMVSYVLFGGDARQVALGPQARLLPKVEAPALTPQAMASLFTR